MDVPQSIRLAHLAGWLNLCCANIFHRLGFIISHMWPSHRCSWPASLQLPRKHVLCAMCMTITTFSANSIPLDFWWWRCPYWTLLRTPCDTTCAWPAHWSMIQVSFWFRTANRERIASLVILSVRNLLHGRLMSYFHGFFRMCLVCCHCNFKALLTLLTGEKTLQTLKATSSDINSVAGLRL